MFTFGKKAAVAGFSVPPQEPAVAEIVIALDQFDAVTTCEGELIGAASLELVCRRG